MTPNKLGLIRFWLTERSAPFGLVLAICIVVPLVALVVPVGPSEEKRGTVLNFGLSESDFGSRPLAVVSLAQGTVVVRIPRQNSCAIGSPIRVLKQHHIWGPRYVAPAIPFRLLILPRHEASQGTESRHCERSEAIQGDVRRYRAVFWRKERAKSGPVLLDCFASLAMTGFSFSIPAP